MTDIPNDPIILMSWTNTKLRDFYPNFTAMCRDLELDENELTHKLADAGFVYDEQTNSFK